MDFTRERLQKMADEANKYAYDFTEIVKREIEERAKKGYYHYKTKAYGVRNLKEVMAYFEFQNFEVVLEEGYLKIYWN